MNSDLKLISGRTIALIALRQALTYVGWLEGVPSAEWNDRFVASAVREAGAKSLLIPPVRRDYLRTPGDMKGIRALHDKAPEWLPGVTCIARFKSTPIVRDFYNDESILVVVWYQHEYAMPIDAAALEQIKAIDWDHVAQDEAY